MFTAQSEFTEPSLSLTRQTFREQNTRDTTTNRHRRRHTHTHTHLTAQYAHTILNFCSCSVSWSVKLQPVCEDNERQRARGHPRRLHALLPLLHFRCAGFAQRFHVGGGAFPFPQQLPHHLVFGSQQLPHAFVPFQALQPHCSFPAQHTVHGQQCGSSSHAPAPNTRTAQSRRAARRWWWTGAWTAGGLLQN